MQQMLCSLLCEKSAFQYIHSWQVYAASLATLPRDVLVIPGVLEQLDLRVQNPSGITALDVLGQPSIFQQGAFNTCLGYAWVPNKNLVKANSASAAVQ